MKKVLVGLVLTASVCGMVPVMFGATAPLNADDPYADATVWFKGWTDDNDDGLLQIDELRSTLATQRPWTLAKTGNAPTLTNEWVVTPYRGGKHLARTLYFPQKATITNDTVEPHVGYVRINTVEMQNFTPQAKVTGESYTVAIRFRPDNEQYRTDYCWIFNWGYNGSKNGFNLGLSRAGYQTDKSFISGGATNYVSYRMYTPNFFKSGQQESLFGESAEAQVYGNLWHDLIISLDGENRRIRYVLSRSHWDKDLLGLTANQASDAGRNTVFSNEVAMTEGLVYQPSTWMLLGSEAYASAGPLPHTNGVELASYNTTKSFRGSIHQLATWNRAMSFEEMKRALAFPRGDLMRVGVRDGTANEFRGGTSVNQEDREWTLPTAFAAGDAATITFATDRTGESEMQQLFRWYGAADSANGSIRLTVNGRDAGVLSVFPARTTRWLLKPGLLVEGTNTLVLTRTDTGAGTVKLDAAALGGSWQVGHKNGNYFEHAHEGYGIQEHEVLDGNTYSYRRVLFGAGGNGSPNTNTVYTFTTPREFLGGNYAWTLTWRDLISTTKHYPRWSLNGHDLGYTASADNKVHSLEIPNAYFTDGVNRLEIHNAGNYEDKQYYSLDYVRLEISVRSGTLMILR